MAIGDLLKDIGEGAATVGRAAVPILQRTSEVVSGEAPQIDAESRKRAEQLEDEQIDAKAQLLENNLAFGQKYGTLTSDQQQQYVDAISGLYNKPRHAQVLMDKLRKAIHPNGMVAQAPQPALANPVPQGGTEAADEAAVESKKGVKPVPGVHPFKAADGNWYQPMYNGKGEVVNEPVEGYTPPEQKGSGKSPPVTGDQLPVDAIGVNGDPISPDQRNAGKSFVEYQGKWWAVAPPKPKLTTLRGHTVLMDANGKVLRDLGEKDSVKVTRRQTLQPGDDGEMHLVTLTSVTTPEGASIDVDPETDQEKQERQESPNGASSTQSKTPAKKVNVGSIIPKTGAKPPITGSSGPVVPGMSDAAHRKLQTTQDRQVLESSKQIISAVDDLLPQLEAIKNQNGPLDLAKQDMEFGKYKLGMNPSGDWANIFENAALLDVVGASIWSRIGRSRYTFEVIRQHLPKPTDSPKLMYEKVKWLKENVVPAAQQAILHPQPDDSGGETIELVRDPKTGKLVPKAQ